MTFPGKCHCGLYHYTFQHWSKVHGESKPFVDPYIQMPFVKDKPWNKEDYDPINPYPTITWKWVCQFCGEPKDHTADCDFYLEYIKKWEDIKAGISPTTPTFTPLPPKPKPDETKPEEEDENTKKTLGEWSKGKDRKISAYQFKKLFPIVDQKKQYTLTELLALLPKPKPKEPPTPPFITPNETPDGSRPPTPEPPIDPLLEAIKSIEKELGGFEGLFSKYIELAPYFNPETEINELGNSKNIWEEESWLEYLRGATNLDDLQGKENDNNRKHLVLLVFANVMLLHYLEKKDIKSFDKFTADFRTNQKINLTDYDAFKELFEKIKQLKEEKKPSSSWDAILDKIYIFALVKKPTSLEKVKEFIDKDLKTLPKSGIEGDINESIEAKKEDLLKLNKGFANISLRSGKGEFSNYQTWTALDSFRDGNCFLNSFSLLMKGDQTLATELRARMCIFLMNNPNLTGAIEEKDQLALLIDKLTKNEDGGKKWPLAKKGEWLFTDDVKFISKMLKRPIRVLYRPQHTQFKDFEAFNKFSKITGGWAKLEYYEPESEKYVSDNWWTICHIQGNHFEPLISPAEDKVEPPTEINIIFKKLNNGVDSIIRGEITHSEYLISRDFENELALLDKETYKAEIYEKIKDTIFKKIGLKQPVDEVQLNKLPINVKVIVDKLLEISKLYNGNGKETENYIDIYFEAVNAYAGGNLMIDVAKRPDGKTHIIGEAWKNIGGMKNIEIEDTDPQPKKYKGKELKRVFLDLDTVEAKQKEKEIKEKGYNHVIYQVKGEVNIYDNSIKSLTFKKGAKITVSIRFPL